MILFKGLNFPLLVVLAGMAGASAEPVDLEKAVGSLVAAEKAYAKLGAEKGFREASLTVLAGDAVIFAPDVVNGRKFWKEAKEDPVISWGPAFAAIARSGELGYTTGPFEYRKVRGDEKPEAFGHFVSVWRKDSDGTWKVVVDVGVNHRQPQEAEHQVTTYVPKNPSTHPETARADFEKQRSAFAEVPGER